MKVSFSSLLTLIAGAVAADYIIINPPMKGESAQKACQSLGMQLADVRGDQLKDVTRAVKDAGVTSGWIRSYDGNSPREVRMVLRLGSDSLGLATVSAIPKYSRTHEAARHCAICQEFEVKETVEVKRASKKGVAIKDYRKAHRFGAKGRPLVESDSSDEAKIPLRKEKKEKRDFEPRTIIIYTSSSSSSSSSTSSDNNENEAGLDKYLPKDVGRMLNRINEKPKQNQEKNTDARKSTRKTKETAVIEGKRRHYRHRKSSSSSSSTSVSSSSSCSTSSSSSTEKRRKHCNVKSHRKDKHCKPRKGGAKVHEGKRKHRKPKLDLAMIEKLIAQASPSSSSSSSVSSESRPHRNHRHRNERKKSNSRPKIIVVHRHKKDDKKNKNKEARIPKCFGGKEKFGSPRKGRKAEEPKLVRKEKECKKNECKRVPSDPKLRRGRDRSRSRSRSSESDTLSYSSNAEVFYRSDSCDGPAAIFRNRRLYRHLHHSSSSSSSSSFSNSGVRDDDIDIFGGIGELPNISSKSKSKSGAVQKTLDIAARHADLEAIRAQRHARDENRRQERAQKQLQSKKSSKKKATQSDNLQGPKPEEVKKEEAIIIQSSNNIESNHQQNEQ